MSDSTLNRFLASGTAAEMAAFTPTPPTPASGPDPGYTFYNTDDSTLYAWDGAAWQGVGGAGTGDVTGPATSTDNAIARFHSTTGTVIQDSAPIVQDDGRISTITDPTGAQDAATKAYVDAGIASVNVGGAAQTSFLVSGGQVVWIQNYEFLVSAASYYINGVLYASVESTVTLDAADATNDRIDTIAVNTSSAVVKVTGTAAAQPSEPDIDPGTQLKLAIVLVTAATTAPPAAANTLVYADNAGSPTEWDWTTSGVGFNVASIADPLPPSTTCIEGTTVAAAAYAQGEIGTGTFDPNSTELLVLYIKSKATWNNNRGLQISLRLAGVLVGQSVPINRSGSFGFLSSNTAAYQLVAIPVTTFAVPQGTEIDQIRITDFGGSIGFFLDNIFFQVGAASQQVIGITQEQADARYRRLSVPLVLSSADDVSGDLPLANLVQASAASRLLGRGSAAGAGDFQEITLGGNLTMTGTVLDASGGSGDVTASGTLTSGQLIAGGGTTVVAVTDLTGDVTTSGGVATTLKAAAKTRTLGIVLGGAATPITTGIKGDVQVPFACTITAVTLLADQAGSIVVDIWKDAYANYPPTDADSITAAAPPTLSAADKSQDTTLTGWGVSITAGDTLRFNVDSVATVTRVALQLTVTV